MMRTILSIVLLVGISFRSFSQAGIDTPQDFSSQKKSLTLKNGITLRYIDTGNAGGIPMILLHGYTDTSRSFQTMVDELLQINPGFRILVPDLRGHGDSSMPDDRSCWDSPESCFTPAQFSGDIIELMDRLKIHKVHLTGHSMGSIIAQTLVLEHPDRFETLVLIGTFVNGKESDTIHKFLITDLIEKTWKPILEKQPHFNWPKDAYTRTPDDLGEEVRAFLRDNWVTEACADVDFLKMIFPETIRTPLGTWIGAIKALGKVDLREALQKLKVPTLILWATQDTVCPAPDQEEVKAAFRQAASAHKAKVIYKTYGKRDLPDDGQPLDDLGHNLHWAAPREVAADINSFILQGEPVNNRPYSNPEHRTEILSEQTSEGILHY